MESKEAMAMQMQNRFAGSSWMVQQIGFDATRLETSSTRRHLSHRELTDSLEFMFAVPNVVSAGTPLEGDRTLFDSSSISSWIEDF